MIDRLLSNPSPAASRPPENIQVEGVITIENEPKKYAEPVNRESPEISKEKVNEMVETFNKFLNPANTALKFEFHEKLHKYYVTIVDSETNEVVKEIPPKKMLDLYAQMAEFLGIIVDKKI
ncbi:flagellar protein FlaG [Peribacillus deserti]|uniref:Flagellar protein FlaG n=1 Tax=Peribacillus deserti TaxID=673318 RepID=A0ABS2QCK7_9BACI|nr:flagellar protein FlaG [Peribacillus deserti]MBM7690891.1 flagellar protein FlaG [Peribacillus deserti]